MRPHAARWVYVEIQEGGADHCEERTAEAIAKAVALNAPHSLRETIAREVSRWAVSARVGDRLYTPAGWIFAVADEDAEDFR